MGIFLKHPWLIPNIFKWQDCKIFTEQVPSLNPSGISHRRCSVKKIFLQIYYISRENMCWSLTHVFASENYDIFNNTYFEEYLRTSASDKTAS